MKKTTSSFFNDLYGAVPTSPSFTPMELGPHVELGGGP